MKATFAAVLLVLVGLLVWSPPLASQDAPYSIYNDGPTGLAHWGDALGTYTVAHGPFQADPGQAVLVVGPRLGYTDAEAVAFRDFLQEGGRAIVADSTGSARSLLTRVPADIMDAGVFSTSYAKNPAWPIAESYSFVPETILSRPHAVTGSGELLLATHPFSWLDTDNDLEPDLDEPMDAWPLAMRVPVGRGELIVVGDPDLFTQEVSKDAADVLVAWLGAGRTIVVDEGHRSRSDPIGATAIMSGGAPVLATGLSLVVFVAAAFVALGVRVERKQPRPPRRPAHDPVLDELPDGS